MLRIKCPKPSALLAVLAFLTCPLLVAALPSHHDVVIGSPFPARLVVGTVDPGITNPRDGEVYHAFCQVWPNIAPAGQPPEYAQRFDVHVASRAQLPLAERTGRLLALLYGEERSRLGWDHPFEKTVHVWITPGVDPDGAADVGGQQFRNQIYIYDIYATRSPEEWLREITHEYGHYALPGVTGFTSPEAWANGFLGQRLFVYWLIQDELRGRLTADDIPFVSLAQLNDYEAKEIDPPIDTIEDCNGSPASLMQVRTYTGMKAYIGLVLYCDKLLGDGMLLNTFADTLPAAGTQATASVYLAAFERAVTDSSHFALHGIDATGDPTNVYLPAGVWLVAAGHGVRGVKLGPSGSNLHQFGNRVRVIHPGWFNLRVSATVPVSTTVTFRRASKGGLK